MYLNTAYTIAVGARSIPKFYPLVAGTAPVQLRVSKRRIDTSSPLYGVTAADLLSTNSTTVVTLSGVDETVTQMMYARHTYV